MRMRSAIRKIMMIPKQFMTWSWFQKFDLTCQKCGFQIREGWVLSEPMKEEDAKIGFSSWPISISSKLSISSILNVLLKRERHLARSKSECNPESLSQLSTIIEWFRIFPSILNALRDFMVSIFSGIGVSSVVKSKLSTLTGANGSILIWSI